MLNVPQIENATDHRNKKLIKKWENLKLKIVAVIIFLTTHNFDDKLKISDSVDIDKP